MGGSGAAVIIHEWQQPPRSDLPFVPAPRRNPLTSVVEAAVPSGDMPVRSGQFLEPKRAEPAPPPRPVDHLKASLADLEAVVRDLETGRVTQADLQELRAGLSSLAGTVKSWVEESRKVAPDPVVAPPSKPSIWSRIAAPWRNR